VKCVVARIHTQDDGTIEENVHPDRLRLRKMGVSMLASELFLKESEINGLFKNYFSSDLNASFLVP